MAGHCSTLPGCGSLTQWLRVHARLWPPLLAVLVAGCSTVGPMTVTGDRFNYNMAGAKSAKEQMLLNLVRLRYGEPIYWLEIGSMLSQYTFQTGASYTAWDYDISRWSNPALRAAFDVRPDPAPTNMGQANIGWSDRPTITYTPLQGQAFANRVMTPISSSALIYLTQSGWSIDRVFECCVQTINGNQNRPIHDVTAGGWVADIKFKTVTAILKKLQDSGHLQFGLGYDVGQKASYLYVARPEPELEEYVNELTDLLNIPRDITRIKLTEQGIQLANDELAIQPRSLLGTMYALAQSITPPDAHIQRGDVHKAIGLHLAEDEGDDDNDDDDDGAWLHVQHSRLPAYNTFTQIYYNGFWFYIPNSDWRTKRTFALLTYLFSLQASDTLSDNVPRITIPAG